MKRIAASLLFLNFSVVHVARADLTLARRLEEATQKSAKLYHDSLIKIETHGIDAFLESFVQETGLRSESVSFLKNEIFRAKRIPVAHAEIYSLVFKSKDFGGDVRVTALPSGQLLLSVLGKQAVWTVSGDPRVDHAAILPFVQAAFADHEKLSMRSGWWEKFSEKLIPSAHAISGGTLVAIVASVAIVVGGFLLIRNVNKQAEALRKSTEAQIAKTAESVRAGIAKVATSASGALDKAGDALTKVGDSVSSNLTKVADSASGVLDSSRAALDAATAQINGVNSGSLTAPGNAGGALSQHI